MRIAALDIGTNTILMLVADVASDGTLTVVRDEHAIARLGKGVDSDRRISAEAVGRADDILRRHLTVAHDLKADRIVAVGTSALRDAANRGDIVAHWQREFGIDARVISSDEEARLTYLGTVASGSPSTGRQAVLDIGGGSTEVTLGEGVRIVDRFSVDIGAVRLTERFWTSYPPPLDSIKQARELIRQTLTRSRSNLQPAVWHAVAGTPTTLAAMAMSLSAFDPSAIDGFRLTRPFVSETRAQIASLSLDELHHHPQIHPQRADIMGAGALILEAVMEVYDIPEVFVSVKGLRYGVALEGALRMLGR
jgi:exopolyphosphatase/guanosine-5'-triphosphate,3'-diphosphate pyrophosphatase